MDIRAILTGIAFAAMWSSAFTSARIIVAAAPPLMSLSLRFLISGLIAVFIARLLGQSWHLTRPQWRATIIFGVCQNALYLGLFFMAMQTIEASLAAILASTMPLLVALAGWVVFSEPQKPLSVIGLLLGFVGVAVIMGSRVGESFDITGIVYCVLGVIALAVATLSVRGASTGGNFLMVVGLQMLVGFAVLAVAGLLLEEWVVTWSPQLIIAFAYTTLVPGLVATVAWFWLVNRSGAVKAATFHFLNPFFGVVIAALVLGETIGILDIVGVMVITFGILAVQLSRLPNRSKRELRG